MKEQEKRPRDTTHHSASKPLIRRKHREPFSLCKAQRRLNGSRFRSLNERLYKSSSNDNLLSYRTTPVLFDVYHEGYRQQVSQWPFNPLTRVIAWLEGIDRRKIIGDFGCGEAQIAQTFPDRTVYSFDFIAGNPLITACNIAKVPLDDNTLDISVFCLSLMGSDWPMFILESTRCLKEGGLLKIVEVKSRFKDIKRFDKFIESLGYKKLHDVIPEESDFFVYCQFRLCIKTLTEKCCLTTHTSDLLLPCPYKRR